MGALLNKDDLKNSLTVNQIKVILDKIGAANNAPNDTMLISETFCHNHLGEGSKKLYYYDNTKLFNCYTSCGSFDIFDLIIKHFNLEREEGDEMTLYQAMVFVIDTLSLSKEDFFSMDQLFKNDSDGSIFSKYEDLNRDLKMLTVECEIYSEIMLNNLAMVYPKPWIEEGITIDTMKRYHIKYYGTDHKTVIPHYETFGKLIGIRGRGLALEDIERYGKYMPLKVQNVLYTHPLSMNLYGLNFNLKNINNAKSVIIFEGEKSVMKYDSIFGQESNISVATCGRNFSIFHLAILQKYTDIEEIVFAYDKQFKELRDADYIADIIFLKKLAKRTESFYKTSVIFDTENLLEYKDSPIDQGEEVFLKLYETRSVLN